MPDTLRRIVVEVAAEGRSRSVDLVLPAQRPVGELVPSIIDTVLGDTGPHRRWHLSRLAGPPLDPPLSLRDNGVRDGDVLTMTSAPITPPRLLPTEPCAVVATVCDTTTTAARAAVVTAVGVLGVLVGAVALVGSGLTTGHGGHLWSAAALSAVAATTSVAVGRGDPALASVLNTAAIVFAVATGVLAVPGAAPPAVLLLCATSALAMAAVLLWTARRGGELLGFAAVASALTLAASVGAVVDPRPQTVGAALLVVSFVAVAAAPRITILAARLGPPREVVGEAQATGAHRVLTALIAGWSLSAALGSAGVGAAAWRADAPGPVAAGLCVAAGIALMLRAGSHAHPLRRIWLITCGFVSVAIGVLVVVCWAPGQGWWIGAAAVLVCTAGVRWAGRPATLTPTARHAVQVCEYVALAAVVPLACWVSGVYGLVRDASLS
ncbi:type VII secretion integral membrane protein EccD [Mycolicibacterium parafortuitum]|uniref:EccD-like transmembrane domain-containing protein n=1 Tax=Mycolicibacterium parafortuitum TaxID=39692 RepID=A0A375YH22_MYCPF|nr:type VII secretion integral membrane protein EccD [Mycolicibacterium parafortuitum]ORB28769.1 type VII secretion integral membrane protein EccD [Mycolicibacterium parafortuitum]SRX80426.1 hypothetical protein MPP7335_02169 [Mycolicibacterium parafortuitum]